MKSRLCVIMIAVLLYAGCAETPVAVNVPNPMAASVDCDRQLDTLTAGLAGPSLIRAKIPNPCDAYRVLATLAKAGAVWDVYKFQQLDAWTDNLIDVVTAGVSYNELDLLVSAQIRAVNKKLGGTYLLVSGMTVSFPETSMINESDQAILVAGLKRLREEARRLAMLTILRPETEESHVA